MCRLKSGSRYPYGKDLVVSSLALLFLSNTSFRFPRRHRKYRSSGSMGPTLATKWPSLRRWRPAGLSAETLVDPTQREWLHQGRSVQKISRSTTARKIVFCGTSQGGRVRAKGVRRLRRQGRGHSRPSHVRERVPLLCCRQQSRQRDRKTPGSSHLAHLRTTGWQGGKDLLPGRQRCVVYTPSLIFPSEFKHKDSSSRLLFGRT